MILSQSLSHDNGPKKQSPNNNHGLQHQQSNSSMGLTAQSPEKKKKLRAQYEQANNGSRLSNQIHASAIEEEDSDQGFTLRKSHEEVRRRRQLKNTPDSQMAKIPVGKRKGSLRDNGLNPTV